MVDQVPDVPVKNLSPKALLFDLDGTLLDTASDMVNAVNILLAQQGMAEKPLKELKPYVSQGGLMLVSRGFGFDPEDAASKELWRRYQEVYGANICIQTRMFPGLEQVLGHLSSRSIQWGIVTNKPERFTRPLIQTVPLPCLPGCVVSGDTLSVSKPDPEPVLYACTELGVRPDQAIMIGDDERDIIAGREAGCLTLAANWGYIEPDDNPSAWGADGILSSPGDIMQWLD